MPELSATAVFGLVIAGLFFSLGTTTVYQANKPVASATSTGSTASSTGTVAAPLKDYPNIIFGSLFLFFSVVLAYFTGRAIFSV